MNVAKKPIILFCILYLSLLAFSGCSQGDKKSDTRSLNSNTDKKNGAGYTTRKIRLQKIPDQIHAVGIVKAYREVEITPEISGKIKNIYFNVGDNVRQGDILSDIEDDSKLISLKKKSALLNKAAATTKKALKDALKGRTLYKQGVISNSESDDILLEKQIAEAELNLARAEVMAAEKELEDTKITAPFDGKIALKDVEIGMLVTPGQSIFTLVNIKKVKIIVNISELDISKISVGDKAEILLDSLPNDVFSGTVETIGLKADDSSRTFPLEIVVLNDSEKLLPGMVTSVTVKSKKPKDVIMISRKAVRTVSGIKVVYLMNQGKIEERIVYTGEEIGDSVVIEKGLNEGDNLIISGI